MADPLVVIGATASIVSIIDILGKSICRVRELRNQWKDSNFTIFNHIAQLTVLKAALIKIKEWQASDLAESHHQLIMDMDDSVTCCGVLVEKFNIMLSDFELKQTGTLDLLAKSKLLVGSKSIDGLQKMIERQTNALTLLLTACNFKTISEQQIFLGKSTTRKTLKHAATDSASLIVHRDTDSLLSHCTDSLSKLSMVFSFDSELFTSKIYQQVFRGSFKTVLRLNQSNTLSNSSPELLRGNQTIDKKNRADRPRPRKEFKIFLAGGTEYNRTTFLDQIRLLHPGYLERHRMLYRARIYNNLVEAFQYIIGLMKELEINFENVENKSPAQYLAAAPKLSEKEPFPQDSRRIFESLWADKGFHSAMLAGEQDFGDNLRYFLERIEALFLEDYLPTDQDIVRANTWTTSARETLFYVTEGGSSLCFIDVGQQRSGRLNWIQVLDKVHFLLFLVPIVDYDQMLAENSSVNRIQETLNLLEYFAKTGYLDKSSVLLLFTDINKFREKVTSGAKPINKYFPEYLGSSDSAAALEFFKQKFMRLVPRRSRDVYIHYTNSVDGACFNMICNAVKDHTVLEIFGQMIM